MMRKFECDNFHCVIGDILILLLQKCLLSSPVCLNLVAYQGDIKGKLLKLHVLKIGLLRNPQREVYLVTLVILAIAYTLPVKQLKAYNRKR